MKIRRFNENINDMSDPELDSILNIAKDGNIQTHVRKHYSVDPTQWFNTKPIFLEEFSLFYMIDLKFYDTMTTEDIGIVYDISRRLENIYNNEVKINVFTPSYDEDEYDEYGEVEGGEEFSQTFRLILKTENFKQKVKCSVLDEFGKLFTDNYMSYSPLKILDNEHYYKIMKFCDENFTLTRNTQYIRIYDVVLTNEETNKSSNIRFTINKRLPGVQISGAEGKSVAVAKYILKNNK